MEFWNSRNIFAPPTYTYEANADDIDIGHLKTILQDGIKFYKDQNLLNMETALLSRIVYRMKTKFRNSKDFHTFEKVKRSLSIYEEMEISKKLEYFLSILPSYDYHQVVVSLPTKNMIDYILVQLQGVGKILTKAIETCKLTVIIYEHRLYLGHFWQLAIIAISLVSRIHVLCLNMIKYTCILYARLLPFSHKLKNVTTNWLPKEYTFPKDLKSWLNIEWSKLEEVIEVPDDEFNMSFIDIAGDSDDDVEYIELSDVSDILEDFKKIRKTQGVKENIHQNRSLKHSFTSNEIDLGEEIHMSEEDEVCEAIVEANDETSDHEKEDESDGTPENVNGKKYISSEDEPIPMPKIPKQNIDDIDIGEVISSDNEIVDNKSVDPTPLSKEKKTKKRQKKRSSNAMVISSSEDEDSVQFVAESLETKKPFETTDFIPLGASTPSVRKNKKNKKLKNGLVQGRFGVSKYCSSKNNIKDGSVVVIPDSPGKHGKDSDQSISKKDKSTFRKTSKRKFSIDGSKLHFGNKNTVPSKKKKQ